MRPAWVLALVGCGAGNEEECGLEAPIIDELRISNNGLHEFSNGETHPSMLIEAEAVDDDGALGSYALEVWYDDVVDGSVDTAGEPFRISETLSSEPCSVTHATLRLILAVTGNPPADTLLEFGVQVTDSELQTSDLSIGEFHTPLGTGEDPG